MESRFNKLSDLAKNYTQYPHDLVVSNASGKLVSTSSTSSTISDNLTTRTPAPEPVDGTTDEIQYNLKGLRYE